MKLEARHVASGHIENPKKLLVHPSQTAKSSPVRIVLAFASMHGFEVWSSDVMEAYLQYTTHLNRDI